ncbi:hypothetical protein [Helicobacter cholecystus]|uniref:hypothetical protein n=1 Tax=Helicobacter cholecystus TaxID=45498 RepID=UPI002738A56F|nr:hypothetical protein [Helicobacter cholecystus]
MKIRVEPIFSYVFFFLFVFVSLAVLVSTFSETFSQLYLLLTQSGRIFDLFLYGFSFLGFAFCIVALILSSWNQKYQFYYKGSIISLCLIFAFILCFSLSGLRNNMDLLDLIFNDKGGGGFEKDPYAPLILGVVYLCFVFLPLLYLLLGIRVKRNSFGEFLIDLMPSINVVIYAMMGFALQGFFTKARGIYYLDLVLFLLAFVALLMLYRQHKYLFGFYQRVNLILLCMGVIFFAFSSKVIEEADFVGRYCFFAFAFVAWCGEWMLKFAGEENPPY